MQQNNGLQQKAKKYMQFVHKHMSLTLASLVDNLYMNLACLSVCLSVCLYPINVKTAEPIGPKFFVGHHVSPGKVYE